MAHVTIDRHRLTNAIRERLTLGVGTVRALLAAAVAATITVADRARGATDPMTEWDPDMSATLLFLAALAATFAMPLVAFRLRPGVRRVALGAVLAAGSGFAIWIATQPVNAGVQLPLLINAGLAIGDAALLLFAPRVASLLAILAAVAVGLLAAPLPSHLIARSFLSVGREGPASFSSWIVFAGVYSQIVLCIGVFVSSPAQSGQAEGEAGAHIA